MGAGRKIAAFADGGEELAVLQLDAVHGDIDLADVNLLVLVRTEIVVAGSPLVNGATKQGEFALVPSAQAQNFIKNLIAHLRCETLSAGIVKSYGLAQTVRFRRVIFGS
jgi:hypothetical protein